MDLFDTLPGLNLRVSEISPMLSSMWQGSADDKRDVSATGRASQLNLVVHFGGQASAEEGLGIFNTAISFAQSYPCRIIVLCPVVSVKGSDSIDAKLFSLCYVGADQRALCACEAVVLGYLPQDAVHLEDLISLWLENDLPVYHWFHNVSAEALTRDVLPLLHGCRRVLFDSAVEDPALKTIRWPEPQAIADLTRSHLLPVRQSLGQFLAGYPPWQLIAGLKKVVVAYAPGHLAEAESLIDWQQKTLLYCGAKEEGAAAVVFGYEPLCVGADTSIEVRWVYADDKYLSWSFCEKRTSVHIMANLGTGKVDLAQQLQLLSPEQALAEALFFAN